MLKRIKKTYRCDCGFKIKKGFMVKNKVKRDFFIGLRGKYLGMVLKNNTYIPDKWSLLCYKCQKKYS